MSFTPIIKRTVTDPLNESPPPLRTLARRMSKQKRTPERRIMLTKKYPHLVKYSESSSNDEDDGTTSENVVSEKRRRKSLPHIRYNIDDIEKKVKRRRLSHGDKMRLHFHKNVDQSYCLINPQDIKRDGRNLKNETITPDKARDYNVSSDTEHSDFVLPLPSVNSKKVNQETSLFIGSTTLSSSSETTNINDGLHLSEYKNNVQQPNSNKEDELNNLNNETFAVITEAFSISKSTSDIYKDTISCEQCGRYYDNQMLLTSHILQEHDSEPF